MRKDGGSDGRGVGFYFRNVTELILFGVRGKNARTLAPGRRQVNFLDDRKREHSRKPDEQYEIIEACSPGPYLELFARGTRKGWATWGNQAADDYRPTWKTYSHHSAAGRIYRRGIAAPRRSIWRTRGYLLMLALARSPSFDPRPAVTRRLMDPSCRRDSYRAVPVPR